MEGVIIKEVPFDSHTYHLVYQLRDKILRKPIGLSLDNEDLSSEVNDFILAAIKEKKIIGCLILTPMGYNVQLRQMAIDGSYQKRGIGTLLVTKAETFAQKKGFRKVILHARVLAKNFYLKQNYIETGNIFTEVGIDHIKMEKIIFEAL